MLANMEVISRPKGIFRHMGIHLPDGRVVHNTPERGKHISSAEEFAAGQDVTIDSLIPPLQHQDVIARISEALRNPQAYHPTANNCETFVRRMLGTTPVSPQLHGVLLLLTLTGLFAVASRRR